MCLGPPKPPAGGQRGWVWVSLCTGPLREKDSTWYMLVVYRYLLISVTFSPSWQCSVSRFPLKLWLFYKFDGWESPIKQSPHCIFLWYVHLYLEPLVIQLPLVYLAGSERLTLRYRGHAVLIKDSMWWHRFGYFWGLKENLTASPWIWS